MSGAVSATSRGCARESLGPERRIGPQLKAAFGGVYIANEEFTRETAQQVLAAGEADAVAFGKEFIANPDLPRRFAETRCSIRRTGRRSTARAREGIRIIRRWGETRDLRSRFAPCRHPDPAEAGSG